METKTEENKTDYTVQYIAFDNHKLPEYKEVRGRDWVYYGADNLYPNYLLELLARCGKHNSIVNSKTTYVAGGGLESENKKLKDFFENPFCTDNADEIFIKIALDYEIFRGYAIGITWDVNKKKVASYQHLDWAKIRESKEGKNILYCEDWTNSHLVRSEGGIKTYPKYGLNEPGGFQVIYYKDYFPYYKRLAYPIPSYLGAITSIETDVEIGNFHLNNIKNGYSGGTVFIFKNGEPSAEKKKEIEKQLKKKHTGTDKAGGMIVIYANRTEDAAEIKNLNPSDLDKQFAQLRSDSTQEIYIGHQITSPVLFGIKEAGQLGARNELIEAFELFNNSYISSIQKKFEKQYNELAELFGIPDAKIKAKKVKPLGIDMLASGVSDVLTRDERREGLGYAAGVKAMPEQMSTECDEGKIISLFKNCGESKQSFEHYKEEFAGDLSSDEKKCIGVLKNNPNADAVTISKSLEITPKEAQGILDGLTEKGIISTTVDNGQTTTTINETADTNKIRPIQVRYEYVAKTGPDKIATTREFCAFLVDEDKLYTREEIDSISEQVGFSVWNYRGGWYHQDNGQNTPYCRHIWKQVSVIKK